LTNGTFIGHCCPKPKNHREFSDGLVCPFGEAPLSFSCSKSSQKTECQKNQGVCTQWNFDDNGETRFLRSAGFSINILVI